MSLPLMVLLVLPVFAAKAELFHTDRVDPIPPWPEGFKNRKALDKWVSEVEAAGFAPTVEAEADGWLRIVAKGTLPTGCVDPVFRLAARDGGGFGFDRFELSCPTGGLDDRIKGQCSADDETNEERYDDILSLSKTPGERLVLAVNRRACAVESGGHFTRIYWGRSAGYTDHCDDLERPPPLSWGEWKQLNLIAASGDVGRLEAEVCDDACLALLKSRPGFQHYTPDLET
jgi:hypothetical protein